MGLEDQGSRKKDCLEELKQGEQWKWSRGQGLTLKS